MFVHEGGSMMDNKAEIAQRTYDILQRRKRRRQQIQINIKHDIDSVLIESRSRHRWNKTKEV